MTVETHLSPALDRIREEQQAISEKAQAYEQFIDHVESIPPEMNGRETTSSATTRVVGASTSRPSGCGAIREAFAETVRPHSVDDVSGSESLLETIEAEFTSEIATALDPQTTGTYTPQLKQALVSAATERRQNAMAISDVLEQEAATLASCQTLVSEITTWLVETDQQPLSDCGFEQLQARHEQLSAYREDCQTRLQERQVGLDTTSDTTTSLSTRTLVRYLYDGLSVSYPVLVTLVRLDAVCTACQRAVRDHLVRRV